MKNPSVVVMGGGLAGIASALMLAESGFEEITILERGPRLGGLAGSFEREGRFYPLGYHHILRRDRTLLNFLAQIDKLPSVRWRKIRMLFYTRNHFYNLGSLGGFLGFPMSLADKAHFIALMLRAFGKSDWSDWQGKSADELIDSWASPGVREAIFEPLCQLKFELPCSEVSAAWLGARLHFREGSSPLGYIPDANWTRELCDGLARLLAEKKVRIRLRAPAVRLHAWADRITEAELAGGEKVRGDLFVSALPPEVYLRIVPGEKTPHLSSIRSTALISLVCTTRQQVRPDFYWMNLSSLDFNACGLFQLSSLNPTIGAPGETCLNFVTHLRRRDDPFFRRTDEELLEGYREDFREIFGFELTPTWVHVARLPSYSPIFHPGYENPPARSATWANVYLTGNYRTFPSIASTGTALESGLDTAQAVLADRAGYARGFDRRKLPREAARA